MDFPGSGNNPCDSREKWNSLQFRQEGRACVGEDVDSMGLTFTPLALGYPKSSRKRCTPFLLKDNPVRLGVGVDWRVCSVPCGRG